MIKGGYILQPRCIDEGFFAHNPPIDRELWAYLLRKVSCVDKGSLKRGQGFFSFSDIKEDLHWKIGFRKKTYSSDQITKALRRQRESNMIATTKATRGVIVTICNYDYYQTPSNYEGNDKGDMKATRKQSRSVTKNKNIKNTRITTPTNVVVVRDDETKLYPVEDQNAGTRVTWRDDFEVYKSELRQEYNALLKDQTWITEQQEFSPKLDIPQTLKKACVNYWSTEEAWKHKKAQKIKTINWRKTLTNALSMQQNKVYHDNGDHKSKSSNGVSEGFKGRILETLLGGSGAGGV